MWQSGHDGFVVLFQITNGDSCDDVNARGRPEQCYVLDVVLGVRVMMLGFGAMLIPSWLFCNNSGEEEEEGEEEGREVPFYSSNPPPPPLEYNPLSPDLQIMQCCSHFNWPGRH